MNSEDVEEALRSKETGTTVSQEGPMELLRMTEMDLAGKRVLIREDLNVPVEQGRIVDDTRIRAAAPAIRVAAAAGAKVMVMAHLGRPEEGGFEERYSLAPVAERLGRLLERRVRLERNWLDGVTFANDEIVLCENVRFNPGEKADDENLGRRMAALCDIFVMDAFGAAHRAQASTHAVARYAPTACAGPLLVTELETIRSAVDNRKPPVVAIMGGAKTGTKLRVIRSLLDKIDHLLLGGAVANTFIAAAGKPVGASRYDEELLGETRAVAEEAARRGVELSWPADVVTARSAEPSAEASPKPLERVEEADMILDIGPQTAERFARRARDAGTIIWNGNLGLSELERFSAGTRAVAQAVAACPCYSLVGGGDTVAAVTAYGLADRMSFLSTGGGAFLKYLAGEELPAVRVLEQRARETRRAASG